MARAVWESDEGAAVFYYAGALFNTLITGAYDLAPIILG